MPKVYINSIQANNEDIKDLKKALGTNQVILTLMLVTKNYIIINTN